MFTLQYHNYRKCGGVVGRFSSILFTALLFSMSTQQAAADDYQTRVALPNSETSLGINEVIFSWSTDETSGIVSVADGTVTDLSMKVDSSIPEFGGTFIDDILVDGVIQPTGSSIQRTLADINWTFDLDTGEVISFLNAMNVQGAPGIFFQLMYTPISGASSSGFFSITPTYVIVYEDGVFTGFSFEYQIAQRSAPVEQDSVRDIPTPVGEGTIFDIDYFEQEGKVIEAGVTSADFCVAPDPRESLIFNNDGSISLDFDSRALAVSELAGTGSCRGPLPVADEGYDSWEELLAEIDLIIPERYRGFLGTAYDDAFPEPITRVWLNIGVVRSSAEFDGPVSIVGFPETKISYDNMPVNQRPVCENPKEFRPIDIGAPVAAFDEVTNWEGSVVIPESVQCNRSWGMTRRTTHIFPVRIDYPGQNTLLEKLNVLDQFAGIDGTLNEASDCANSDLINTLQTSLENAELFITNDNFSAAVAELEQLAIEADNDDLYDSGGVTGFNECPSAQNYRGNFVSRGLTAAFTVFDRLINPLSFVLYELPEELADYKPDLRDLEN